MRPRNSTFLIVLFLALCGLMAFSWYTASDDKASGSPDDQVDTHQREFLALRERLRSAEQESLKRSKELNLVLSEVQGAVAEMRAHGRTPQLACIMTHHLPHLLAEENGLQHIVHAGQGRTGVSLVLGVPSVKRSVRSYLTDTLRSLISELSPTEKDDCVIVVFVAETDQKFVSGVAGDLKSLFPVEIESGLLEVISPPAHFYPDLSGLKQTYGDSQERVRSRTKQNLDYAFLMAYAQSKGTYYVQLEDDIVARPNYVSAMKRFALQQLSDDWMVLEFCHKYGFIGKMFKSSDLPLVVEFLLMFHKVKPCDWLLDDIVFAKGCRPEASHCDLRIHSQQSLFQHVGTHSSLDEGPRPRK